jgi:hypothetical protein
MYQKLFFLCKTGTRNYTVGQNYGSYPCNMFNSSDYWKCISFIWKFVAFGPSPLIDMQIYYTKHHCLKLHEILGFGFVVFNATFNNISVISWRSVVLVEDTWVPGENHRPLASHWQTFSHNVHQLYPLICKSLIFNYEVFDC